MAIRPARLIARTLQDRGTCRAARVDSLAGRSNTDAAVAA
jgi:hypothetical protein